MMVTPSNFTEEEKEDRPLAQSDKKDLEISFETLYAIDKVVRRQVKKQEEALHLQISGETSGKKDSVPTEHDQTHLATSQNKTHNMTDCSAKRAITFEEWCIKKKFEQELKDKLISNVKTEIRHTHHAKQKTEKEKKRKR